MASTRRGLGKGLDSLIPASGAIRTADAREASGHTAGGEKNAEDVVVLMKTSKIEPNREQPRTDFKDEALEELAESIRQFGVLQPLLVQKKENYYEIIAGERRWRAAKMAGLREIPVIIRAFSRQEAVEIALIENIQREDLNPIEEAKAYKKLAEEFGLKQDEIARRVSKSRTAITNAMRLLRLDERVQEMVSDGSLSVGHARALLARPDHEEQYEIAGKVYDEHLSVRETEHLLQTHRKPGKKQPVKRASQQDFLYRDMEEKLRGVLGTKVSVQEKGSGHGKIEIEYYTEEELERIYQHLLSAR